MSNRKIEKVISVTQGNLWLTKRVKNKTDNLSTDGSEKGKGIGEQIVRGIRFPVMTQHEFAAVVDCCMMLTQDQALILFSLFLHSSRHPSRISRDKHDWFEGRII